MDKISKDLLKEFVNSQHFASTADTLNGMKELFSDMLSQVMKAEPEEKLGYEISEQVSENNESVAIDISSLPTDFGHSAMIAPSVHTATRVCNTEFSLK